MNDESEQSAAERMLQILRQNPLLLAVTLHGPDDWRGLGELLEAAQLKAVEIMLRSPYAWDGLDLLQKHWPKLTVGIGTVLNKADLQRAADLGAAFAVSPGTLAPLLETAWQLQLPYLPGAVTPSDLMQIASSPFHAVKFFPAAPLGPAYLQAIAAPFPEIRFCVSGGLEVGNYRQFLQLRQVAGLSGSWPLPRNLNDAEACAQALPQLRQLIAELGENFARENPPSRHSLRP